MIKEYVSDDSADGLDTDGVIEDGDTVTFSLTVENQGDVAAFDIEVSDYMGTAYLEPGSGTAVTTTDGANAVAITALVVVCSRSTRSRPAIADVLHRVGCGTGAAAGGTTFTNWAEITDGSATDGGATAVDIDSTPDGENQNTPGEQTGTFVDDVTDEDGKNGGDEDDHDPSAVTLAADFDLR